MTLSPSFRQDGPNPTGISCPLPLNEYPFVTLAHGGGGKLMNDLIAKVFLSAFSEGNTSPSRDAACFETPGQRLAFTTDSYVVRPLFFPGGDIGTLAVHGTVNDLAMCGAKARFLSAGFILEEGLSMDTLWRIVQSMARCAREAGVQIVTGDTKVVDRGKGDGIFINTAGIGERVFPHEIGPDRIEAGNTIVVSGDLGRHGIAVMAEREGLGFATTLESDCANLWPMVEALRLSGVEVRCLRDLTRGGLVSALNELSRDSGLGMTLREAAIPLEEQVRGACEILGLDPLSVANEGRFVAIVKEPEGERTVSLLRDFQEGRQASIIGQVDFAGPPLVRIETRIGARRILPMLSGEQLPRIC